MIDFDNTPDASMTMNVNKYVNTFKHFIKNSIHCESRVWSPSGGGSDTIVSHDSDSSVSPDGSGELICSLSMQNYFYRSIFI